MKRHKLDWAGDTTPNFRMSWLGFVLHQIAHALFLHLTFDAPCSKFFTLTLCSKFVQREVDGLVQVLAIAHHRRQPGYWVARL